MKFSRLATVCTALALSACIFVPVRKPEEGNTSECKLQMPKWTLTSAAFEGGGLCNGTSNQETEACLVTLGIIIPAGSLVVSGSIVVTGNTLRWLEYQGRCDDSTINKALALLKRQANSPTKNH